MARKTLTDRTLKSLKPAARGKHYDLWDAVVPGLGVRVSDTSTKTFVLMKRYGDSKNPTRGRLGIYGAITLDDARTKARHWQSLLERKSIPAVRRSASGKLNCASGRIPSVPSLSSS